QYEALDNAKNEVYLTVSEDIEILDHVLSQGTEITDTTYQTRIRLLPYLVYEMGDSSNDLKLKLDYSASIRLRRLEKLFRVIVNTGDLAPLPDTQPDEEDNDPQIGLQRLLRRDAAVRVGVRVRWPPVGYIVGGWSRRFNWNAWQIQPRYQAFYQTDEDGFGTGGNLLFGRWWDNYLFENNSGFRITEATEGIEWASAVTLGHVTRLIEPVEPRPLVSTRAYNEGINLIYRISGHISGHKTIDEHRVILNYRFPIRKNWMFLFVSPEISWERDNGWVPEEQIRIGVDILLWGITR
ncbi:MAG: hypothetical protein ACQKBT_10915, partial [Puniceicoccales bacterium]